MDTAEATLAYAALAFERRQPGSGVRLAGVDDGSWWRLAPLIRKGVLDVVADGRYRPSQETLDAVERRLGPTVPPRPVDMVAGDAVLRSPGTDETGWSGTEGSRVPRDAAPRTVGARGYQRPRGQR